MLFIDYTKAVLQSYNTKRENGSLSSRLAHPSPAELRDECEAAFEKPYNHADAIILKTFFGQFNNRDEGLQCIRNHSIDKFRPLVKFLKGGVNEPKKKNVDLIAWLIDFNPRPFELGRVYNPGEAGGKIIDEGTHPHDPENNDTEPEMSFGQSAKPQNELYLPEAPALVRVKKKLNFKTVATPVMIAIVVLAGIFIYKEKGNTLPMGIFAGSPLHNSGHCMYWAGDHYEPTPCTPKRGDTLLVELDSAKLFRLKKIIRPEIITKDDIGRVAYIKLDGRIEYYTDTGFHPVYTHKRLKPLTKFMFDKYILPQKR
ncbi:hypothetical protein [Niabella aquatica]